MILAYAHLRAFSPLSPVLERSVRAGDGAPIVPSRLCDLARAALIVCVTCSTFATPALAQADEGAASHQEQAAVEAMAEVRVYATAEKDMGFAPQESETASKTPTRILQTPHSISVVTREDMQSRQAGNLQQALEATAGVSPVNYGRRGFDDIFIRGFRSTESILIDGLPQSPGIWTRMQNYGYERYEVLKGANSILYGQMQPGGMVNAISKRPRREAMGELHAEAGSFGRRAFGVDINRPISESGKAALRINAFASNDKDPTDFVWRQDRWLAPSLSLDFGANTDFVIFATYSNSQWLRQQGISPHGTVLPNPHGTLRPTMFTGEPGAGGYDIDQYTVGYNLQHRFAGGATLRQNVRYEEEKGTGNFVALQALRDDMRTQNRQLSRQHLDYDLLATDTSLLLNFDTGALRHQLVAGVDARVGHSLAALKRCTIAPLDLFDPRYGAASNCPETYTARDRYDPSKLTTVGFYLQDQIKFGQGWTLAAGLRHERSRTQIDNRIAGTVRSQRDAATTGSLGLVYEFAPGWSAYGSFSSSFLPVAGEDAAGNHFRPETGRQLEAGVKYVRNGWTASAAVYELRRRNVTTSDPDNDGFSIQTGQQRARGLELEAGADLANGLKLTSAYAYTQTEVTHDTNANLVGKPLNLTPRHTLALWADWRIPAMPAVRLAVGGRYVSTQRGNYAFVLPSYAVADASISYTGSNWRLTAGVKNLFDRAYYAGAINANVVSPGMPRSFNLTAKYLF